MRSKYHWGPLKIILHLVLDNAGGYGTDDCITRYVAMLKTAFNIECIQLDLSVWTILQSEVERQPFMKRCHVKVLVSTVMTTWDEGKLDWQIMNIFKILEKVLCFINEGEGGNDLVESKRGEKNRDLKFDFV